MLRRQASDSAHPGTGLPSGRMGTGQAGHRIFGSRTSPAGSGVFGQAHCHRLRRSFGFGGVGQDRVSARELRTRQDPAFRRMACQAEPRLRPRILPEASSGASVFGGADGRERGRKFQIRQAANWQGSGPVGEPPGDTIGASVPTDSGGCGARVRSGYRPSKPPIVKGPFRRTRTRRDSGGRQRCRPPLLFGGTLCSGEGRSVALLSARFSRRSGRRGAHIGVSPALTHFIRSPRRTSLDSRYAPAMLPAVRGRGPPCSRATRPAAAGRPVPV